MSVMNAFFVVGVVTLFSALVGWVTEGWRLRRSGESRLIRTSSQRWLRRVHWVAMVITMVGVLANTVLVLTWNLWT
jgi:uncharacterized membrane protein